MVYQEASGQCRNVGGNITTAPDSQRKLTYIIIYRANVAGGNCAVAEVDT